MGMTMRGLKIGLVLGACLLAMPATAAEVTTAAVLKTYAAMALAGYTDALTKARDLDTAVTAFLANPTDATLKAARQAYIDSRPPYQQPEAFRFGNPEVDDREGRVNAWPLDEGLIDYVATSSYGAECDDNPLCTAILISNTSILVNGMQIDASLLTP